MPSGRVHALGPGVLLAEIQQTSDTTYRIYDWDRTDEAGNKRELHLKEAMQAIDFKLYNNYKTEYQSSNNKTTEIVDTPFFTTNIIQLNKALKKDYSQLDSFVILLGIEGKFGYRNDFNHEGTISAGASLLIPAFHQEINIYPIGDCKILEIYIIIEDEKDKGKIM
jgi:mannose-6-phosphate isomerase